MEFHKDQSFSISSDALFQEVGGETVLLDLVSENYFGLDETGTRIWTLLNEGKSVEQILGALLSEYEVERETLEQDLDVLLRSLIEAGLIQV